MCRSGRREIENDENTCNFFLAAMRDSDAFFPPPDDCFFRLNATKRVIHEIASGFSHSYVAEKQLQT